jgi:hypothetical protein
MGLYQTWYDMRGNDDRTLTVEDIRNGRDISDRAIFDSVFAPPQEPLVRRWHTDDNVFRRRDDDNSDRGIFNSVFEDAVPARPYAGPRSQHDRD